MMSHTSRFSGGFAADSTATCTAVDRGGGASSGSCASGSVSAQRRMPMISRIIKAFRIQSRLFHRRSQQRWEYSRARLFRSLIPVTSMCPKCSRCSSLPDA